MCFCACVSVHKCVYQEVYMRDIGYDHKKIETGIKTHVGMLSSRQTFCQDGKKKKGSLK